MVCAVSLYMKPAMYEESYFYEEQIEISAKIVCLPRSIQV